MSKQFYLKRKKDFLGKCDIALRLLDEPRYVQYSSDTYSHKPKDEILRLKSLVEEDKQPPKPPRETWLGLFAIKAIEDIKDPLARALSDIAFAWRRLPPMD